MIRLIVVMRHFVIWRFYKKKGSNRLINALMNKEQKALVAHLVVVVMEIKAQCLKNKKDNILLPKVIRKIKNI